MPSDHYDLSILAACPELLAELGWLLETGDDEWWKRCEDGTHYPREIYTLAEATASDRREAIGLLEDKLPAGWSLSRVKDLWCYRFADEADMPEADIDYCGMCYEPYSRSIGQHEDRLHALHAAYVAQKGQ